MNNLEKWMQSALAKSHVDRKAHTIRHKSGAVSFGGEAHYDTSHVAPGGLFGGDPMPEAHQPTAAGHASGITDFPVHRIYPNPNQPRKRFDEGKLRELGQSMKTHGQIQHGILVHRPGPHGDFMIVAGERRWRAAQIAGLPHYRAEVKDLSDDQIAEIALLENVTRTDLSPIEEAQAYKNLLDYRTEEQVSAATGKQVYHIRRRLRLLDLAPEIQDLLDKGQMPPSHAETLSRVSGETEAERHRVQASILRRWVKDGWNIDQVTAAVDAANAKHSAGNTLALFDQAAYKPTGEQRRAQRKLDAILDAAGKLLKGATDEKTLKLIPTLRGLTGRDLDKVRLLIKGLRQLEKAMAIQQDIKKTAPRPRKNAPVKPKPKRAAS